MESLEFGILGQLEVRRHEERLSLGGHRQRAVLALLVIQAGRVISVDRLIDELWGEDPPPAATATLHSYVSKLRRVLEPDRAPGAAGRLLSTEAPGYTLQVDPAAVDAGRFERLAEEGRTALAAGDACGATRLLGDALALWRGPALADFAFEPFAAAEAARLEELRLTTNEDQFDAALALGQHAAVVADLEQLVGAHPLRERLRGQLMLALYRAGRQAEALRAYQSGRAVLGEELGIDPSPALKALEQSMLLQDPALDWTGRGEQVVVLPTPAIEASTTPPRPEMMTFLLTDVERSTRLWTDHPDTAGAALARHDEIVAEIVTRHGGSLPSSEGDSFLAAFARASDAVAAVLDLQQALVSESWPGGVAISVRASLHTGEAVPRAGTWHGLAVNRGARLRALAHGGQILCSQATRELVADHLPTGANLRDLGTHRLRDLDRPERVWQLCHPDLPIEFPPLEAVESPPHNLPAALTRFVGRGQERAELNKILEVTRLLTLVGAGGIGKTRLAVEVAGEAGSTHPDGIWLVDLSSLSDPRLVPRTVAAALGVTEDPGRPLVEVLAAHLRSQRTLLVLDSCEHVVADCAGLVADLLRSAPGLQVLATSREPLRVEGEVAWRVPSLSAPDLESMSSLEELAAYEAVELFLERARAARPSLELRPGDASALARIVARLDGIPLALELAAARMGVLSLEQIAERLTNRFSLLASTGRGAPSRHQTLRAAIDWSYELLAPAECELLTRLSVFPASFELEAAEAVGTKEGDQPGTVLDLLDSLVAKSLVVMDPGPTGTRYRLLETIRHYAAEKLAGTPAEAEARTRHRDFYLGLAQVAEPEAFGSDAPTVLDRLEADHDNFRAVLELATVDPGSRLAGLRLAHALYPLWEVRDHRQEGRTWMEALVAAPGPADDALASAVARRAGNLARTALDLDGAAHLWGQALTLAERSGDPRHRGRALLSMGRLHHSRGTLASARTMMEDSLALARQVGDEFFVAESLVWLGWLAHEEGRYQEARARVGHGEAAAGDNWLHIGRLLNLLGCVERDQGDYPAAGACFERCREVGASVDDRYAQAEALDGLGSVALAEDRLGDARAAFEEAVMIMRRAPAIATSGPLGGLGELAALQGEHGAAAGLLGEELEYARRMVDPYWVACTLVRLGRAEQARNDLEGAAHAFCEALAITSDAGMPLPLAGALEGLVAVRAAQGAAQEGALLMARAQALRRAIDAPLAPSACPGWEQTVGAMRNALGEARFAADWAAGEAMALEEAVALALGEDWTEATPSV